MTDPGGCQHCEHDVWDGPDRTCRYRPHDYGTPDQRAIVGWLADHFKQGRNPFNEPMYTCPKFQDYRRCSHG